VTEDAQVSTEGKRAQSRTYVILDSWNEIDRIRATSAPDAIRKSVGELDDPAGQYVAVAERSFQPVTVSTETKQYTRLQ
jgi:hypothetical protein